MNTTNQRRESRFQTRCFATAAGLLVFVLYFIGLAPGVTLEDSGELTTAAYHLGIAHPPGYPLYTLFGALFTRLPFGSPAFNLNLMSAVLSAVSVALLVLCARKFVSLVQDIGTPPRFESYFVDAMAALCGILVGVGPSFYRQSVITEVYGLNNLLSALMLLILLTWFQRVQTLPPTDHRTSRYLYAFCFILGLALSNHHTAWMFFPFALVLVGFKKPSLLTRPQVVLTGLAAFALGLLPYVYLPIASSFDPVLDWGNPEGWREFWHTVTRFQYQRPLDRSPFTTVEQLRQQVILLFEQIPGVLVFAAITGWALLLHLKFALFAAFSFLLLLSGPVTAWITNFAIPFHDSFQFEDVTAMVSVFYLPHYMAWGLLLALALSLGGLELRRKWPRLGPAILIAALTGAVTMVASQTLKAEDKSRYAFAEAMFRNWEILSRGQPALFLNNWDPFSFPAIYYQQVERRAPHLRFVDLEMMKTPWYIQNLERWYPDLFSGVESERDTYLASLDPMLTGETPYTGEMMRKYLLFANALVAKELKEKPVYITVNRFTHGLSPGLLAGYRGESQLVATRLRTPDETEVLDEIQISDFDFSGFEDPTVLHDRLAQMLSGYYAGLILDRALAVKDKNRKGALDLLDRAQPLAIHNAGLSRVINESKEMMLEDSSRPLKDERPDGGTD